MLLGARNIFDKNALTSAIRIRYLCPLVVLRTSLADTLRTRWRDLPCPPTHALRSCRPTRSVSIIVSRGACAGRFSAGSIPSPSTTTSIARNGSANDSSCFHRFSRSISALPIQLDKYLSLLDWTGRQFRAASRGAIPTQLAPILERLGIIGDGWIETGVARHPTVGGLPDTQRLARGILIAAIAQSVGVWNPPITRRGCDYLGWSRSMHILR
jgi:hypothetical protein